MLLQVTNKILFPAVIFDQPSGALRLLPPICHHSVAQTAPEPSWFSLTCLSRRHKTPLCLIGPFERPLNQISRCAVTGYCLAELLVCVPLVPLPSVSAFFPARDYPVQKVGRLLAANAAPEASRGPGLEDWALLNGLRIDGDPGGRLA